MTTTTTYPVEALAVIRDQVLAVTEAVKGSFDAEIAAYNKAKEAFNSAKADSEKILADATAKAAQIVADANAEAARATDAANAIASKAAKDASAAASAQAKVDADAQEWKAQWATGIKAAENRAAALDVRESVVAAAEKALQERQSKLDADVAAFNKRLEALKI